MVDGRRGHECPHHLCDAWSPDPGGVHHDLGLDRPDVGEDAGDRSVRGELDPGDSDSRADRCPVRHRRPGDGVGGGVWVQEPVSRHVDRSVQRLGAGHGHPLSSLLRRDQVHVETDPLCSGDAALEFGELLAAGGQSHAPDRLEGPQLSVELDRVPAEPHHRGRGVEHRDEPNGVTRRPARELALLEHQDVGEARLHQVQGDAAAGDPSPDDHDPGPIHHSPPTRWWGGNQPRPTDLRPVPYSGGISANAYSTLIPFEAFTCFMMKYTISPNTAVPITITYGNALAV